MTRRVMLGLVSLLLAGPCYADFVFTASAASDNLSASAKFEGIGSELFITLTNTSQSDVLIPSEVLTAVFFKLQDSSTLTAVSALLANGSTVYFGPDGGGNVGGEWAYESGLLAPNGANRGISSSGFGLFGAANFGGTNLTGPDVVNGGQYGITSAGDNMLTGNAKVTGGEALIKNAVVFKLSGLSSSFQGSSSTITDVSFQYGTALSDPNLVVPEANPMFIWSGLASFLGICVWRRRARA